MYNFLYEKPNTLEEVEKILNENTNKFVAQIANDNSEGQIVLSGKTEDLENLIKILKDNSIKNLSYLIFHFFWKVDYQNNN